MVVIEMQPLGRVTKFEGRDAVVGGEVVMWVSGVVCRSSSTFHG